MIADVLGTGVAFPLQVDGGGLALASGGTDVSQAIAIILSTAPGERPMRPEFGCDVHAFVFERIDGATTGRIDRAIRAALARWEPRIEVESVDFDVSGADEGRLVVDIGYRLRATNSRYNLIHPFYVVPAEAPR
ncbi:MAG TPA: GPW/gp25 family protein [Solirubrobacteraceae bacterium]|nr:GPW/gp25 family protein [Solirubrobacteraceae bacterium]